MPVKARLSSETHLPEGIFVAKYAFVETVL